MTEGIGITRLTNFVNILARYIRLQLSEFYIHILNYFVLKYND